MTATCS